MKRICAAGLFALVALCFARPSFAAVTTAMSIASPSMPNNTYTGPCPVTVTFNATISGPSGTPVTYHFAHYVGGVWANTNDVSTTLPVSPISNTLTLDAAHSGFQSNELQLTVPAGVPNAKIYFTINCQTGPATYLAPPANLRTTNDLAECRNAAGGGLAGFACAAWMNSHAYVLIWDWSNAPCPANSNCPSNVDGFQVYDAASGKALGRLAIVHAQGLLPNQVSPNSCFLVRAQLGTNQSAPSQTLCVNAGMAGTPKILGNRYMTLVPAHARTSGLIFENETGILGPENPVYHYDYPGQVFVGFRYATKKEVTGDVGEDRLYRAAVYFDLSPLAGDTIRFVSLHLHVASSTLGSVYGSNNTASCIGKVGFGRKDWWNYADWIEGNWFADLNRGAGPNVSLDVTNQLRMQAAANAVLAGGQNFGFVFRGLDENVKAFTEDSCVTHYDNIVLNVTYTVPSP